ncbi:MAG TPA: alpha/beta hydrolase [Micromonosporaceae bacterium]|jgi:pimeloyl-ACP methyl ester carboxylesterase
MSIMRVHGSAGVELAVRLDGDPTSPPLVLLHALGESSESWAPLLPRFTEHYYVAAFDLRGHGASDWPGAYSTELMRDDVITAIDELGFGRFTLIGHSLGGGVALQMAEQLGDRIDRLVIEDVVPPYPRELRPVPERPDEELLFDWDVIAPSYAGMTDPAMREWPALATITAPTLVIGGGPTSHVPGDRIAEMAELIPDCTVRTIDAGHHVHVHAPDEFAETVMAWLTG